MISLWAVACLILAVTFHKLFDRGEDFQLYSGQIQIEDAKLAFGENRNGPSVAVIGTIKNDSDVPWEDLRFFVEFLDANGERRDVGHKLEYSAFVPANQALPFKATFPREFNETNYAKFNMHVVFAKDARFRW